MTTSVALLPSFSASAATSRSTYLDRFVQNLSPEKVKNNEWDAKKWHIVSIVALVAMTTICVVTLALVGAVFPLLFPVVGVGAVLGGCFAGSQFNRFQEWSNEAQANANKHKNLQRHYAEISGKTPLQLQRILQQMGIVWTQIPGIQVQHPEEGLTRLTPVIAYAKLLEEHTQQAMEKKNALAAEAQRQNDPHMKAIKQSDALNSEFNGLAIKILNAFANAVLRNPDYRGNWEELGNYSKNNFDNQVLGNALGESTPCQMFIFNNRNVAPITYMEAKTMSVAELGQRFINAMAG